MNEKRNEGAKKAWRDLGFFYDFDENRKSWEFTGSIEGLEKFCRLLILYTANSKNNLKSEHAHFGPYQYLKIMTWDTPVINENYIGGTLEDLKRLANIISNNLEKSQPNGRFVIQKEYSNQANIPLVFNIKGNDFDPAFLDPFILKGDV